MKILDLKDSHRYNLQFDVDGQFVKRTDNNLPVAKCKNLFKAKFNFIGDEWTGTKTALFAQGECSKSAVLDDKDECVIPWEFFETDENMTIGKVSVSCGDLVTTNCATVKITKSGYQESDVSVPPSPDVYQQLIELAEDTKKIAQSVRDDADAGEFDGEEGYSPKVSLTEELDGVTVTVQNKDVLQSAKVKNGKDGKPGKDGDPGANGITPHIGENENWHIGGTDTGKPSRGPQGENATDKQVRTAVDAYMEENPVAITVDPTLAQEGQAADAKATGDKILQYAIKNTASGEGIVKITDSADEKLQDFKLFGKSEQLSTTGKNLFDISKFPFEHDAEMIVIKPSEGQTSTDKGINITEDIKFEENTQYVISYDSYNVTQANENWTTIFTFYYTDGAYRDLYVNHFYGNLKKYFNSDSGKTIRNVAVRNPWKVGIEISKVQIEKGNVATDYEPYTGGKPSPSIEYQQEIVNAGESGQIEVQVTGKNLLEGLEFGSIDNQGNIIQSTTAYVNINKFIEVKEGKHVINSRDGKRFLCAIFLYDKDKQFIRLDQSGDCVVRKGEKYINITSAKSLVDGVDKTQIELADKSINPTAYKPYKGLQKVQFQLDEPLRGIGDYRDTITKDGIVRKVKEDVLNGSEYWVDMTKETFKKVKRFGLVTNDITYNTIPKANLSLCDKFPIGDINTEEVGHVLYSNRICFMVDKEQFADLEVWKAWLSQNPVTVQYALKEPIVEPLPTEIKELFTYYPITVISNDQNCGIEVEYVADTKLYTDNKIAENVASIISQYQTNVANLLSLMPLSVQAGMVENDTNNILENVEEMKHE